jgi:uncharacterized Tic20 family protein
LSTFEHQRGKGLPPVAGLQPFLSQTIITSNKNTSNKHTTMKKISTPTTTSYDTNYACMLHLSGLAIVTGIPFVNIILPACLWLAYKDNSRTIDLHGRLVINFQLTITIIQFIILALGVMLVWWLPATIQSLLNAIHTMKVVFSTAYSLPFNLFTFLPFTLSLMISTIGAISAYHNQIAPSLFGFKFLSITLPKQETPAASTELETKRPTTQSAPSNPPKRPSFG